jgi:hypothetical protein
MTADDITRMAREAGLIIDGNNSGDDDLFAFAAVVSGRAAALEREACAKVCEAQGEYGDEQYAAAIRARSQA